MANFFEAFTALAQTQSVLIYTIIFFGKLMEVSVSTLRIVLINRGIRLYGSMLAVIEIVMWLIITSTVMAGFQKDPFKIVVYALAFGLGNFMGSWLDEKLAFGLSNVQILLTNIEDTNHLAGKLRDDGYGVTIADVHGMDDESRYMMFTMIQRKRLHEALHLIKKEVSNAVITVSDVKVQKGGYLRGPMRPHYNPLKRTKADATMADVPDSSKGKE